MSIEHKSIKMITSLLKELESAYSEIARIPEVQEEDIVQVLSDTSAIVDSLAYELQHTLAMCRE